MFLIRLFITSLFLISNLAHADDTYKLDLHFEKIARKDKKTALLVIGANVDADFAREHIEMQSYLRHRGFTVETIRLREYREIARANGSYDLIYFTAHGNHHRAHFGGDEDSTEAFFRYLGIYIAEHLHSTGLVLVSSCGGGRRNYRGIWDKLSDFLRPEQAIVEPNTLINGIRPTHEGLRYMDDGRTAPVTMYTGRLHVILEERRVARMLELQRREPTRGAQAQLNSCLNARNVVCACLVLCVIFGEMCSLYQSANAK